MKAIRLTSHAAAMDLVIQLTGNRVVPGQRFRPIPQLFMGASSEEGAQTFLAYREAVQHLQGFKQHGDRHGIQHHRL